MRIKKINLFILLYISISCTLFATFPLNKNNIYQSYKLLLSESKSQSQEISYENYFNFHQESNLSLNAFNKLCIKKYENQFSSPSLHSSSSSSSTNNEIANEEIDEPNYKLVYQKISIDTIRVGDLLYEPNKAYGLGHIAIVESIRWSTKYNKSWIRVIEAQGKDTGVRYSSLDDTRLSSHNAFIYRVVIKKDFSNYQSRFEHFIHQQWHKEYELRYLGTTKKTSINSDSWYCSELAWAAWLYIGYDIERPSSFLNWSDPGVTPLDIVRDNKNKVYKLC